MFDSHAHILSRDIESFPPNSPTPEKIAHLTSSAFDADDLCKAMDRAGVAQALIVQRSQYYGSDNSFVCAAAQASKGRLSAVCAIDSRREDCAAQANHWMRQGAAGLRIMGPRQDLSADWLDGEHAKRLWRYCADEGTTLCCHLFPAFRIEGLAIIDRLLSRYPLQNLVIDHLSNPTIEAADWEPDDSLRRLADHAAVALKFTTIPLGTLRHRDIDANAILRTCVALFGADRMLWGSDITQSPGSYEDMVGLALAATSGFTADVRHALLEGTARRIYC